MLHLFRLQGTVKDAALPVGEPLLEYLVSSQLVAPHCGRDVAPVGAVVEVDAKGGVAEGVCGAAQGRVVERPYKAEERAALARMRRRSEKYASTAVVSLVVVGGMGLFYAIPACG